MDPRSKNVFGQTPLHLCSFVLDESKLNEELDKAKASMAAIIIFNSNVSVSEKDQFGMSALDYATKIKDKLPHLHKVMQAGKIRQDFEEKYCPKPDANGAFKIEDLMNLKNTPEDASDQWGNAMSLLIDYLPKSNDNK